MDRLISLVILLFCGNVFAATSSIVMGYSPSATANPAAVDPFVQNWSVRKGYYWQSPNEGSLSWTSRMSAQDNANLRKAVGGSAAISQAGVKNMIKTLAKGGVYAVIAGYLIDQGLQYINGDWQDSTTAQDLGFQDFGGYHATMGCNRTSLPCWSFDAPYYGYLDPASLPYQQYQNQCTTTGGTLNAGASDFGMGCTYSGTIPAFMQAQGQLHPLTASEWDALFNSPPNNRSVSDQELADMISAGYAVPLEKPVATVIGDFSNFTSEDLASLTAMGYFNKPDQQDYPIGAPSTDPVTGKQTQPYARFTSSPGNVIGVNTYDQPVNSSGVPSTDPVTGLPITPSSSTDPCTANPNRAGCVDLNNPEGEKAPKDTTRTITLTPDIPWGSDGQCPSDVNLTVLGQTIPFSFTGACTFMTAMRPVVIGAAWIVATLILIGSRGGSAE